LRFGEYLLAIQGLARPTIRLPSVVNLTHQISAYLTAFREAGLEVLDCREPVVDEAIVATSPSFARYPEAARQALPGMPYLLLWHLRG
jgi:hypothetical protein